ncbi:helix-turn-helix domain-containing protein [Leuconostoc citreum]|uniref:helix-turn-helix domain-containing protein n=1 Tax=Leuconostoc citreum TaxID=33964 RepID=UPI000C289FFC|nr:helix-turn-helix transcriptional regulator [Leuconostoc citreum]
MLDKNILLDGEKLKSRRISLNMSQSELAREITTQATISLMENTNRVPNIAILLQILNRLNINLASPSPTKRDYEQDLQELFIKVVSNDDGADVKIMDRFFRHREVQDSKNFSKPGFQLKTA